jgi:hypothetical protein
VSPWRSGRPPLETLECKDNQSTSKDSEAQVAGGIFLSEAGVVSFAFGPPPLNSKNSETQAAGTVLCPRLEVSPWRSGRPPLDTPVCKDNQRKNNDSEAQAAGDKCLSQAGGVSLALGPPPSLGRPNVRTTRGYTLILRPKLRGVNFYPR